MAEYLRYRKQIRVVVCARRAQIYLTSLGKVRTKFHMKHVMLAAALDVRVKLTRYR